MRKFWAILLTVALCAGLLCAGAGATGTTGTDVSYGITVTWGEDAYPVTSANKDYVIQIDGTGRVRYLDSNRLVIEPGIDTISKPLSIHSDNDGLTVSLGSSIKKLTTGENCDVVLDVYGNESVTIGEWDINGQLSFDADIVGCGLLQHDGIDAPIPFGEYVYYEEHKNIRIGRGVMYQYPGEDMVIGFYDADNLVKELPVINENVVDDQYWMCSCRENVGENTTHRVGATLKPGTHIMTPYYEYKLNIANYDVRSTESDDIERERYVTHGKLSYDPATHTLTMDNVIMEGSYGSYCIENEADIPLNIVCIGENRLIAPNGGQGIEGNVNIKSGSLTIESSVRAIKADSLTIYGGAKVTAGTQADGRDAGAYDSSKLSEYKYISIEPSTSDPGPAYFLVTVNAGEGGSVSAAGGATGEDGLLIPVIIGGDATFTIVPDEGYVVESVTVDGAAQTVAPDATSFTVSKVMQPMSVSVTFAKVSAGESTPAPTDAPDLPTDEPTDVPDLPTDEPTDAPDLPGGYAEWDGRVATQGGRLNLRATPVSGDVMTRIPNGAKVRVLNSVNGWLYVRYGSTEGYVSADYIAKSAGEADGTHRVATNGGRLNIRALPVTGAVIGKAPNGALVDVVSIEGGWALIRYNGIEGWASADYLKAA